MQVIYIKIYYSLILKKLNHMMYHMKILQNQKNKNVKNKLLIHNVFQWTNEFMTYKEFFSHMREMNNEQRAIVDDILYQKIKKPYNTISYFFNRWCKDRENVHLHVYYTKQVMTLY